MLPGLEDRGLRSFPAGWSAAGIDEVGRGCLAGPVVACAVSLPEDFALEGLDDSKKLTAEHRETLAPVLRERALAWGIGVVWPARIDEINILQATFEAMSRALLLMARRRGRMPGAPLLPARLLVDGNKTIPAEVLTRVLAPVLAGGPAADLPPEAALSRLGIVQRAVVKGDSLVPAISAASVLAKVWRDRLMTRLAARWPGYGFEVHKGYGTAAHYEALRRLGPCPMHRLTFRGVDGGDDAGRHAAGRHLAD
ncbi:MAG: ribonuclease HII [Desulfovibrionaceae bacterium]|nr:ribonuclease HII [Desulfovibrionaceae bacterium]